MVMISHPLAPLLALSFATSAALCALALAGARLSAETDMVLRFGWTLMLLLWMDADARRLRRWPCFDFGFLAALFFPLSLLWYCFWSRRWRGLLILLLLLGLWLGPFVVAAVFSVVLQT